MRLWLVNPKVLCQKHLLGEHVECHMFVGALNKGKTIKGFLEKGLLEIHSLRKRHDELVREMIVRGMKHNSPLPAFKEQVLGQINVDENYKELSRRCEHCSERIEQYYAGGWNSRAFHDWVLSQPCMKIDWERTLTRKELF